MAVEGAVGAIPSAHTIGALSLELDPLKGSLKAEAASWKAQFAKNLHAKGAEDLRVGKHPPTVNLFTTEVVFTTRDRPCRRLVAPRVALAQQYFLQARLLHATCTVPCMSARPEVMGSMVILQALKEYMKDAMASLNRKVADLDDVRLVMTTLKEVRTGADQETFNSLSPPRLGRMVAWLSSMECETCPYCQKGMNVAWRGCGAGERAGGRDRWRHRTHRGHVRPARPL